MPDTVHAGGMINFTQPGIIPLYYDDIDRTTTKGTILVGGSGLTSFVRGTLMGRVGVTSNWTMALAAAGDGSQTPRGILAADVDLSAGSVEQIVFTGGLFNSQAITLGTGIALDTATRDALKLLDITFKAGINP